MPSSLPKKLKQFAGLGISFALVSTAAWGEQTPSPQVKSRYPSAQKTQNDKIEKPKKVKQSDLAGLRHLLAHYLWEDTVQPQNPLKLGDIKINGMANLQANYWTHGHFDQRDNKAFLDLDSIYVNLSSQLNDWTQVSISGLYKNAGSSPVKYWPSAGTRGANRHPRLQEAKVTFANLSKSPLFARVGQMYLPFGRYKRYPLVPGITQQLTQIHSPGLQIGGIYDRGIYWTIYGIVGHKAHSSGQDINNYGGTVGYRSTQHPVNYDLGVSYLHNLNAIDSLQTVVDDQGGYQKSVPAIAAYGDLQMGPFSYGLRYVSALRSFDQSILAYQKHNGQTEGARPDAFDIWSSFQFKTLQHHSSLKLAYGMSRQAYNTASIIDQDAFYQLPKARISMSYNVNLVKNVVLMANLRRDRDYEKAHGGTNEHEYVASMRLSYLF